MSVMVAVFTRELRQWSRLLVIAAALAVLPFLIAIVPFGGGQRTTIMALSGGSLAVVYASAVAVLLGVSVVGRDLGQKRLSFYFSRPIGPVALWSGKAAAALLTVFAAMLIVGVPAYLASGGGWWSAFHTTGAPAWPVVAGLIVALFAISHTLSTMTQSRSAWIAVDFVCAIAVSGAMYFLTRELLAASAMRPLEVSMYAVPGFVAILLVAPAWQLAHGRVDARRSHAALSTFIWTSALVILVVLAAYVCWVVYAPLSSIRDFTHLDQNANGEWALVAGQSTRGSEVAGFVNTRTGEVVRTRTGGDAQVMVARDGSAVMMWMIDFAARPARYVLEVRPFAKSGGPTMRMEGGGSAFGHAIAPDGSRVAAAARDGIQVFDAHTGALIAAARTGATTGSQLVFVTPTRVRSYDSAGIHELDVTTKTLTHTGSLVSTAWMTMSDDASRLYLPADGLILDARTGAPIATLPVRSAAPYGSAMLNDGRVVVLDVKNVLHVFDRDGRALREIPLPLGTVRAAIRAQLGTSRVILGGLAGSVLVDIDRGTTGTFAKDVRGPISWTRDTRLLRLTDDANVVAMNGRTREVVVWDPRTGAVRSLSL